MMNKTANDYYNNRLQPPKAFFEWCYRKLPSYIWKNKQKEIVSSTRKHREVIEKRLTKKSRLNFIDKYEYFEIVLCTKKRIERQIYRVYSEFVNGQQHFNVDLINMHLFTGNKHIKIHKTYLNYYTTGLIPIGSMFSYQYCIIERYPNNWIERLEKVSELKYLNLNGFDADDLPHYYKYRDRIEFMQKIGAKGIEREFTVGRLDCRRITLNWLKKWKLYIRNSNHTFEHVKLKQGIEQMGGKMIDGIENYLKYEELSELPNQMSIVRFQNYLIRQQKRFSYYQDYLSLLGDLELEITNRRRFPKELEKAHNEAVDTLKSLKQELVRVEFETRAKELSELEIDISEFTFVLPKKAEDLVDEGKALKHCVCTSHYMNRHADGQTTIVFVRKRADIDKSYFTLEYKDNQVFQLEGVRNREAVPDELREAVDEWVRIANKRMKGRGKKVA